jgi:hypothetical protein
MNMKYRNALLACGLLVASAQLPLLAYAADATPQTPSSGVTSLKDLIANSGIKLNAYIDTAYTYSSGDGVFASGFPNRVFDTEQSSFNLHQAALTVGYQPTDGFGALVNLTAGRDARVIKSYDTTTNDFDVTQAFVQYVHGPFTIIAGKYVTLAGAEVINPTGDVNYSRSILFGYAIPFAHTGIRATYALNDQIGLVFGINNGWDQLKDANSQKTLELGASYTPNKMLSLLIQGYTGTEQVNGFTDTAHGTRSLVDAVATITATDQLSFVVNFDYGSQDNFTSLVNGSSITATWIGFAGYANYALSDQWRLSLRGEYFDDQDGYRTGVVQAWKEATLTAAYMPLKSVEIRAEVRGDWSDKKSFVDNLAAFTASSGSSSIMKDQYSFALEGLFKF